MQSTVGFSQENLKGQPPDLSPSTLCSFRHPSENHWVESSSTCSLTDSQHIIQRPSSPSASHRSGMRRGQGSSSSQDVSPTSIEQQQPSCAAWWSTEKVASTALDAIIGKLSARNKCYFEYDELDFFIKDGFHPNMRSREPLINRGYFARVDTIRYVVLSFIQSIFEDNLLIPNRHENPIDFQVVNIGAGLDPFYFWLKGEVNRMCGLYNKSKKFKYIELDLPELLRDKRQIIEKSELLMQRLEASKDISHAEYICTNDYVQVPCDLRVIEDVELECKSVIHPSVPTFYLVECVLVYLEPDHGDELLKWMTRAVPNAAIALCQYEPFNPKDRFGTMMSSNLALRGCPLLSLNHYSSLDAHIARYKKCHWGEVSIADMYSIYNECLDPINRIRIEQLELFDEMEEWRLIQQHYFTGIAVRRSPNRVDYHPLTALISFWETSRLHSEAENQCSVSRFSTEELRKTSSHMDVLEKVASRMLERRDSDEKGVWSRQAGRATLDAEGIRGWLQRSFTSIPSRNICSASAPNINNMNNPHLQHNIESPYNGCGTRRHGCSSPSAGQALEFVLEEQASPKGGESGDEECVDLHYHPYNNNNESGLGRKSQPGARNSNTEAPRMVSDVLKDLMKN